MLVDAFEYNGENIYLTERFRGLLGGLHLGFCYRSEISAAELLEGGIGYVLAAAYVNQVDEFNKPCRMHTEVTVYDKNWQENGNLFLAKSSGK